MWRKRRISSIKRTRTSFDYLRFNTSGQLERWRISQILEAYKIMEGKSAESLMDVQQNQSNDYLSKFIDVNNTGLSFVFVH